MRRAYPLTIGLPQTNYRRFAEVRMLMEAGNFFWWALGEAIGRPVAQLRSATGQPVYATISFLEERFPDDRGLGSFGLDDRLRFLVGLRAAGPLAVEAHVVFDREHVFSAREDPEVWWGSSPPVHPQVRFVSVFASPVADGAPWQLAMPTNAILKTLEPMPHDANPLQLARSAHTTGRLGLVPEAWVGPDRDEAVTVAYTIDPDRDTNAAGLVYFANYIAFIEAAEREALRASMPGRDAWTERELAGRHLQGRRVAYYGNVSSTERLVLAVSRFASEVDPQPIGLRTRVSRARDGSLVCLSEALMSRRLTPPMEAAPH